jgi:hypothetical protein
MHYLVFQINTIVPVSSRVNGSVIVHSYCTNEPSCEVSDELQVIQQAGRRE